GNTEVLGISGGGTSLGGPGMCFSEEPSRPGSDIRVGDISVLCVPDSAASPCSGVAVALEFSQVGVTGTSLPQQVRIDLAAVMSGVVGGKTTSGTLKVCAVNVQFPEGTTTYSCLAPIPFQTLNNGEISLASIGTLLVDVSPSIAVEMDL